MRLPSLFLFLASLCTVSAQTSTPVTPAPSPNDTKMAAEMKSLRQADETAKTNPDAALPQITAIIQGDPQNTAAYVLRAEIYSQKKMYEQAYNDFQAAHLINPNNLDLSFDVAEMKFLQKQYDAARPGFLDISMTPHSDIGDLSAYKVFLCDLFGGHEDAAAKELDAFNKVGSNASYYYANAAWDLYNHKPDDARSWLASAGQIYGRQKNSFFSRSLFNLGYLPLPPAPVQ